MTRPFTLLLFAALAGCGAMNTARPLERGESAAGVSTHPPHLPILHAIP